MQFFKRDPSFSVWEQEKYGAQPPIELLRLSRAFHIFSLLFGNCHKPLEIQAVVEAKSSSQDPNKKIQAMDGHKWLVREEDL